jgi:hypothetical protein
VSITKNERRSPDAGGQSYGGGGGGRPAPNEAPADYHYEEEPF